MPKINIYRYYREPYKPEEHKLCAKLNAEQLVVFCRWQKIQSLYDKLNYITRSYNDVRSLNTMSHLYKEVKAKGLRTETLNQLTQEMDRLRKEIKELEEENKKR